jgi:hypothetical protein
MSKISLNYSWAICKKNFNNVVKSWDYLLSSINFYLFFERLLLLLGIKTMLARTKIILLISRSYECPNK